MTLLSAVNVVLTSVNLEQAASVDTPDSPVVARAKALVEDIDRTEQEKGWWFNQTGEKTLSPDVNDNILISSSVLSVQPTIDRYIVAVRGGVLYDMVNDTDEWGSSLSAYLTYLIDFEDTPTAWQEYVAREAALQLHQSLRGNTGSSATVAQARDQARAMVKSQDYRSNRHNVGRSRYMHKITKLYRR